MGGWTCRECSEALSDYHEGILPLSQFLRIRVHLFNCPGCRALLATLRALPALVAQGLPPEAGFRHQAQRALEGALARLAQPAERRTRTASPVPEAARMLLEGEPDPALRLLAAAHACLARERTAPSRPVGPVPPIPQPVLDQLPGPERWTWQEAPDGARKAELLGEAPAGPRLALVYTPPSAAFPPHQHLGSESILVLEGSMTDQGHEFSRGGWVHHANGSCHAPRVGPAGCWCLVREEGTVRMLGPAAWLPCLGNAS